VIREERNLGFWRAICEHPGVKPWVSLGVQADWLPALVESPRCLPLACSSGGYFLVRSDLNPAVWDLHAAFRPEGWGKVAHDALQAVLSLGGWDLITVSEVAGNWRSRPPRSFGFRPAAQMGAETRTWILTRNAWEQSPAYRRMERTCLLS
jgi:hypothetical protein